MAFIGTFSRALLESATAVYFGGASVSILDAQGNVILGDDLPDAPTVTSTIADRTYAVGDAAVTVDLRTKFSGATSYTVSPTNAAVTIDGYTLTINPAAAMTSTSFTVRGVNGGGPSAPLTFTLTVTAPVPVLEKPFPDQSLLIGGGTVTLPLAEHFSGATGYAVSPANSGVTISNGNLVISRTTARDVIITVTATNATGQDTSDSFALLIAAPANQAPVASAIPQQTPTANTAFSVDLSSYFVDPEGAALSFDYTGTLPTGITRNGAVFSGTATVTDQTASGVLRARDPGNLEAEAPVTWAVSAQPTITATIDLQPAGQQATITFNTTPDTVTVTQGSATLPLSGTGTSRSFTPATTQPVSISATKSGYSPYSAVIENVQPATPVIVDDLPKGLLRVDNVSSATGISFSDPDRYDGMSGVIDPAVTAGPQSVGDVVLRVQDGTEPAVGKRFVVDIGPWASEYSESFGFEVEWLAGAEARTGNGNVYDAVEGDEGKAIGATVIGYDASGSAGEVASNTLLIPAPQLLKTTDTFTTEATSPISIDVHSGNNDADNRVYNAYGVTDIARVSHNDFLYGVGYGFVSTSEAVGPNYKVEANARTTDNSAVANGSRGIRLAAGVKSSTVGFQISYDHATGLLRSIKNATSGTTVLKTQAITLGYREAWKPALTVHEHNDGSGNPTATLRVYVNDMEIPELSVTDPDLRGGKPGFRAEAGTSSHHYFFDLTVEKLA